MKAAALLTLATVLLGCTPAYHRPPALRYDRPRSASLEQRAHDECFDAVGADHLPERRFVTDGCTLWPDGWWTGRSWQHCCIDHDIAYWCGGPSGLRHEADRVLEQCVAQEYSPWMGSLMRLGTSLLGGRYVPAHWRWGYGHDYPAAP